MKSPNGRKPLFERLKMGLEEGIRHAKGEITLKTTIVEMPDRPPEVGAEELTKLRLKNGMSQVRLRPGAQCFNQNRSELGTGPAQAVAGVLEINPGVSSRPVRPA